MIDFVDVAKTYRSVIPPRTTHALRGLTLSVGRGEVLGIAGPNGAGKSTLLSMVLGFVRPTRGRVEVGGRAPRSYVETHGVSYVPELVALPGWWTVAGTLDRTAVLSGLEAPERTRRIESSIHSLGLEEHRRKQVKQLSKGNRQRLGIAQALLSDAELVVFDEPTHGLDPVWTQRFRTLVEDLRSPERCILIASHNLDELERVSDRVAILDYGRVTRVADLREAHAQTAGEAFILVLDTPRGDVAELFPGAVPSDEARNGNAWLVTGTLEDLNRGVAALIAGGGTVRAFYPRDSRLEAAFREAVGS